MGDIAARIDDEREEGGHFGGVPAPKLPHINAVTCFQRAIEFAPDMVESYRNLFDYERWKKRPAKAAQAGRKLLDVFPDHLETLRDLGELLTEQGNYAEALTLYQARSKSIRSIAACAKPSNRLALRRPTP